MLSSKQKQKLKQNWAGAEALACKAEVRLYDPASKWQCYLVAIDPQDDDTAYGIISSNPQEPPQATVFGLQSIFSMFNSLGEGIRLDASYRPILASSILKKLQELTPYER